MDKAWVLARLKRDNPRFHYLDAAGAKFVEQFGFKLAPGDISWAVSPRVLRWIAEHLTPDMVSIETGAGHSTVVFAALSKHHYCCTPSKAEVEKIRAYLETLEIPADKVTFLVGSSDEVLPRWEGTPLDFAYIDGCHGYPFPALDWHYIDRHLKVGSIVGMDNAELRPVREHCDFLEENGTYRFEDAIAEGCLVRFYTKVADQGLEWTQQPYSIAKKDPCDQRLQTRIRRKLTKWIKPYLL